MISSYVNVEIIKSVLQQDHFKIVKQRELSGPRERENDWLQQLQLQQSTARSTVPVRAMLTSRMTELNDEEWLDMDHHPRAGDTYVSRC